LRYALRYKLLIILSLAPIAFVKAQGLSNLHEKVFSITSDTTCPDSCVGIKIDSLSIIGGSVIVEGIRVDSQQVKHIFIIPYTHYTIDEIRSTLTWKNNLTEYDSIKITYRTYPFAFTKPAFHKDISMIEEKEQAITDPFVYIPNAKPQNIFDFGGLNYNGSFARGISFGNNQNVVVNSSFNLQLSGMLNDDIEVLAAITDNNIPIQPEGNTQQIQDFDKVFIQLKKDNTSLIVGDFPIQRPQSYFMNFNKKVQGGKFNTSYKTANDGKMAIGTSVAVSRGQFSKHVFIGEEGNQGPYKLKGSNGELFIIILAGTERVYIDGELLTRGAENDYIIDYNTGEITFMPSQLITKDKRIVIEFQYSAQNYFRSLLHFNSQYQKDKLKLRFNLYTEQDNKNQPIRYEFTGEQKKTIK